MLEFKKPCIEDKSWFNETLKNSGEMGYEYAFGSVIIWSSVYNTTICKYKDFIFIARNHEANPSYFICGNGNLKDAIEALEGYVKENKRKLIIRGITKEKREQIENLMPGKFVFEEGREYWNYIYNVKALAELKGKKLRNKRNHVYKFCKLYKYESVDIDRENINECKSLSDKWFEQNKDIKTGNIMSEVLSLENCFKYYEDLNFKGIMIKVDGRPIAFTIGEAINSRVFVTHFEKALVEYEGSYNIINQEFAKVLEKDGYELVNREEDLGIEGLRKAKTSYRPEILLEKYMAISKE